MEVWGPAIMNVKEPINCHLLAAIQVEEGSILEGLNAVELMVQVLTHTESLRTLKYEEDLCPSCNHGHQFS